MRIAVLPFVLLGIMISVTGCGSKSSAFDNVDMSKVVSKSVSGSDTVSDQAVGDHVSSSVDSYAAMMDVDEQGIVMMDDMDNLLDGDSAGYSAYEVDSNEGIERAEDGSIAFHIGDVSFIYTQDIDIQLVTAEDSNAIYVKGLDPAHSSMRIGVYSGEDYADQFETVKAEDHIYYDINGNEYWMAQSPDNRTWYYAYEYVLEPVVVVVSSEGNFKPYDLKVCLPTPEVYDVARYDYVQNIQDAQDESDMQDLQDTQDVQE